MPAKSHELDFLGDASLDTWQSIRELSRTGRRAAGETFYSCSRNTSVPKAEGTWKLGFGE